jgi:CRP/FNR family transcriptional regulator
MVAVSLGLSDGDSGKSRELINDHDRLHVHVFGTQLEAHPYTNLTAPWREALSLIKKHVTFFRLPVSPKEPVYTLGKALESLYVIYSGAFKIECLATDGRMRNAEMLLDGEWLGFDAIPTGHHTCTATALDYGEVWVVNYEDLLQVSGKNPTLLAHVVTAISKSLGRSRDQMLSVGSLSSDGRVADFLVKWALDLSSHGRRSDVISVPLTRADIGNSLGMRIETVSRSLSRLAEIGLIQFDEKSRRYVSIPEINALKEYVLSSGEMRYTDQKNGRAACTTLLQ